MEDIKKITSLVESVKNEFVRENEILKSRLALYSQNFNNIAILERDAIIETNKKYSEWLSCLTTFSLAYYSLENWETLKNQETNFIEKQLAFEVAENQLSLFMHDEEIRQYISPLRTSTFHLQIELIKQTIKYTSLCRQYKETSTNIQDFDNMTQLHVDYLKKQQEIIDSCASISEHLHYEISSFHIPFIKVLNHRIYQLVHPTENT